MNIRGKLILAFLAVALLVGTCTYLASNSVTKATLREIDLTDMKFSFDGQKSSFVGFINEDEQSRKLIIDSHIFIQGKIQGLLTDANREEKRKLLRIKQITSDVYLEKLNREDPESSIGLIEKRKKALEQFLTANERGLTKITQFKRDWGTPQTYTYITDIIVEMNRERAFLFDFNPRAENWKSIQKKFRDANEKTVEKIVHLLEMSVDEEIAAAQKKGLTEKGKELEKKKLLVKRITTTTFPKELEELGGNDTSLGMLVSIITSQQKTGIQGEVYMNAGIAIQKQILDTFTPAHAEFDTIMKELLEQETNSSKGAAALVPISILIVTLGICLFGLLVAHTITKPIVELSQIIEDLSHGKIGKQIDSTLKNKKDETGRLARAFDRTMVSLKLAMKEQRKK